MVTSERILGFKASGYKIGQVVEEAHVMEQGGQVVDSQDLRGSDTFFSRLGAILSTNEIKKGPVSELFRRTVENGRLEKSPADEMTPFARGVAYQISEDY